MLTDSLTGKVIDKVEGKNHVFSNALLSKRSSDRNWQSAVSTVHTVLTDSSDAVDTSIPYLRGNIIGFGIPSVSGSGDYRGAYNSANQVLAAQTIDSTRWKFQYDFTTAQANGTINTVGLTYQYSNNPVSILSAFNFPGIANSTADRCTCDGRYAYSCTTEGVITKFDVHNNTSTTIDVSSIVGTSSSAYKNVGYAADTGKYYILTDSSTASERKLYEFSDDTFSTIVNTYEVSNIAFGSYNAPIYIYGNYIFQVNSIEIRYANFVSNTAYTALLGSTAPSNLISGTSSIANLSSLSCAVGKFIFAGYASSGYRFLMFDMNAKEFVSSMESTYTGASVKHLAKYPLGSESIMCFSSISECRPAIAQYVLPNPITKTPDKGMTVTYELEVFWQ